MEEDQLPKLIPCHYGRHLWTVAEDWVYKDTVVPKGYITDLDSIHFIPYLGFFLKGYARWAALRHDWGYSLGAKTRKEVDEDFRQDMIDEGVPTFISVSLYIRVRVFGWYSWNLCRKHSQPYSG